MGLLWQYIKTILGIIFRHPLTGVSIIPVLPDGNIVLIRRRDTGKWAIPGGFVDWGENIPTTVQRELKEETGLELVAVSHLIGVYSEMNRDPRVHSICILVEAKAQGDIQVQDKLEILEVKTFARETIPLNNLSYDHNQQMQDYLENRNIVA